MVQIAAQGLPKEATDDFHSFHQTVDYVLLVFFYGIEMMERKGD